MKKLLLLCIFSLMSTFALAASKQTWFCLKNDSGVEQRVYSDYINNSFWDGSARPDERFNDVYMPPGALKCARFEVNSREKEVHFAMHSIGYYRDVISVLKPGGGSTTKVEVNPINSYAAFSAKSSDYKWGVNVELSAYPLMVDYTLNSVVSYKHWMTCNTSSNNYYICKQVTVKEDTRKYSTHSGYACEEDHPNCVQFSIKNQYGKL